LMWAWTFFFFLILAHHLSCISIGCLALPSLLILFFFIIKTTPSSWLILICSWGVFSCSTYGFGWGFTCCFTNCLVGHIDVWWP
jgi:hypothetical protein